MIRRTRLIPALALILAAALLTPGCLRDQGGDGASPARPAFTTPARPAPPAAPPPYGAPSPPVPPEGPHPDTTRVSGP